MHAVYYHRKKDDPTPRTIQKICKIIPITPVTIPICISRRPGAGDNPAVILLSSIDPITIAVMPSRKPHITSDNSPVTKVILAFVDDCAKASDKFRGEDAPGSDIFRSSDSIGALQNSQCIRPAAFLVPQFGQIGIVSLYARQIGVISCIIKC